MVVLLTLGLVLIVLALVPGLRRAPLLLAAAGLVCSLVARSVTADAFHVLAAGVLPVLLALLVREMAATAGLVAEPRRSSRRLRQVERRPLERRVEQRERERRRRERRRLAA